MEKDPTIRNFRIVQLEGKRKIERNIDHFNLDMIISVGYRVNSKNGIKFRQWATQRLKDFLLQGYAINEARLSQKQQEVQTLRDGIRILCRAIEQKAMDQNLDWLNYFAKGLELLDDYDHENLDKKGLNKRPANYPEIAEYKEVIQTMRSDFESGVFGKEKEAVLKEQLGRFIKDLVTRISIQPSKKKPLPFYT